LEKKIVGPIHKIKIKGQMFNFCQLLKIENAIRPDTDILSKVTLFVSYLAVYTLIQK